MVIYGVVVLERIYKGRERVKETDRRPLMLVERRRLGCADDTDRGCLACRSPQGLARAIIGLPPSVMPVHGRTRDVESVNGLYKLRRRWNIMQWLPVSPHHTYSLLLTAIIFACIVKRMLAEDYYP